MSGFSRRRFLKAAASITGAAAGARLAGSSLVGTAAAATEPTSVVTVHFWGGYSAIWGSAASHVGDFGVTSSNITNVGDGITFDNVMMPAFSDYVRNHMAVIGVTTGPVASHSLAIRNLWANGTACSGHQLADALGGTSPNKALLAGRKDVPERPVAAVNGVAYQRVLDMKTFVDALGGSTPGPRDPDRKVTLAALRAGEVMSKNALDASPSSLLSLRQGYADAVATLKQPAEVLDLAALQAAYGLGKTTAITSTAAQFAAAELFVRSGANVASIFHDDPRDYRAWDTHGDSNGNRSRAFMASVVPSLRIFLDRMVRADSPRNVVVVLMGDFARSLPDSDHARNLSATVIGRYVKRGTTGRTNAKVQLVNPAATSSLWSYVCAVAKAPSNPFGPNPHGLVL